MSRKLLTATFVAGSLVAAAAPAASTADAAGTARLTARSQAARPTSEMGGPDTLRSRPRERGEIGNPPPPEIPGFPLARE